MLRAVIMLAFALPLSGCNWFNTATERVTVPVALSVAERALGADAYSIDPFHGNNITTPGIYNVRENQARQICENDTSQITTIADMRRKTEMVEDDIEDVTFDATFNVNIFGQSWEAPYRKVKVREYTIDRVFSGDSTAPEDWILDNVNEACRELLDRNRPYIVVTSVATARRAETISGGGKAAVSFGIGPAVVNANVAPYAPLETRNRVFAVAGRLVPAEQ